MVRKGSSVRVRQRAFAPLQGRSSHLGSLADRLMGPFWVHQVTRGTNLVIRRDPLAVPVLDHAGVVLLDHPHARPDFLGDLRERDPLVDAERHIARAEVPRPCPPGVRNPDAEASRAYGPDAVDPARRATRVVSSCASRLAPRARRRGPGTPATCRWGGRWRGTIRAGPRPAAPAAV